MVDYHLYDLSPAEFEDLAILICRDILGIGTVNFSEGRDGGRDGKFVGLAQNFPSKSLQWNGKFIIQAKRKNNPLASCSDSNFLTELNKELSKIKKLKENGEIDYYILFTSRKLSAGKEADLVKYIIDKTGIKDAKILAKEWIELTISSTPSLINKSALQKYRQPLRIFPENLKEVITAFKENIGIVEKAKKSPFSYDFEPNIERKNELNKLSAEYFSVIEKQSQSYFSQIVEFLNNPINKEFQDNYYNIVEEINNKLTVHRNEYAKFEEIFEVLYDQLYGYCPELRKDSRLIYVFLHFMYCNCDIGVIPKDD
jgi:hypothetical protein